MGLALPTSAQAPAETGEIPSEPPPPPAPAAASRSVGVASAEDDEDAIVLSFEQADIREVVASLAGALGISYQIDDESRGR